VSLGGTRQFAEKVRKLVEKQRFEFDRQVIPVTVSVGIATLEPHHREAGDLVRETDAKLYEAKTSGRNRVVG
jgi:diguanylate cyclase (GGDEF)-like protein